MGKPWGKVIVGSRLEKQVSSRFMVVWSDIISRGLSTGDGFLLARGMPAHKSANHIIRQFLKSEADSLLFLDSDADVGYDIIDQFRRYEPGTEYDVLQAFYCRRGWPPKPIWLKRLLDAEKQAYQFMECFVLEEEFIEDVALAGTHCCMVRREVLETILGDNDPEEFEWFCYTRHNRESDEVSLSRDALAHGFRIGATTAIKTGHLTELTTGWDTYKDWLDNTGRTPLVLRYRELATLVGEFLGEEPDVVVAKSFSGTDRVAEAWRAHNPQTPEEVRAFYGMPDNGYLYELIPWNCCPLYEKVCTPLRGADGGRALVIGAGLGTEVATLLEKGLQVEAVELPGVLADFLRFRYPDLVIHEQVPAGPYSLVVAVDVIEHIHPDELPGFLARIDTALVPGGYLCAHVSGPGEDHPQHFDAEATWNAWIARYENVAPTLWRKGE
jgi:hypothetical protein